MESLKNLATPILLVTIGVCHVIKRRPNRIFQEDLDGFDGEFSGEELDRLGVVKQF